MTWKIEDILLKTFKESRTSMKKWSYLWSYDKFEKWKDVENWYYDLVHTTWVKRKKTALSDYEHLISSEKTIEIDWKIYRLWEVSNILVWYNAYFIGYDSFVLDLWAMAFTFWDSANPVDWKHMSNWIEGEFRDRRLYEAWYKLAKDVEKNGWILTEDMLVDAIKTWIYNRKVMSEEDAIEFKKLKEYYSVYKKFNYLILQISDVMENWLLPKTY